MITLRSSATFVTTKDYIRLYLLAALVVAISIILESVIAFTLPGLADATIYQVLRKDLGPLGMVRAHGLMMEPRSEEHTSELQSLMRISYAVFCLKKKKKETKINHNHSLTNNKSTSELQYHMHRPTHRAQHTNC